MLWLGIVVGVSLGLLWSVFQRRNQRQPFFAAIEYWVYSNAPSLPDQALVMERLHRRGITPAQGLVMSDIRLGVGLVLKSKNPHVFRPDLLQGSAEPSAQGLRDLANSSSMIRIRFIAEKPPAPQAALEMLPMIAESYAELAQASQIYDRVACQLFSREDFAALFKGRQGLPGEFHTRVNWQIDPTGGGNVATKGLIKLGLPELETELVPSDQRLLAQEVLQAVLDLVWKDKKLPESISVEAYGDTFRVDVATPKNFLAKVRIHRIQSN